MSRLLWKLTLSFQTWIGSENDDKETNPGDSGSLETVGLQVIAIPFLRFHKRFPKFSHRMWVPFIRKGEVSFCLPDSFPEHGTRILVLVSF